MYSVNWTSKVITIHKADMVHNGGVDYELQMADFHDKIRQLEYEFDEGMSQVQILEFTPVKVISGVTYAAFYEVINGYTVTFEDDTYKVVITGGNNNVYDIYNVNSVSVGSYGSAGNTSSPTTEFASFNGGVTIDVNSGETGTAFPRGTGQMKIDNIADAILIAKKRGFNKMYFHSDITLDNNAELDNYALIGQSHTNIVVNVLPSAEVENVVFAELEFSGTLDGGNSVDRCIVGDINFFHGHIHNSALTGTIALSGNKDAYIVNSSMSKWGNAPTIDMGNAGQNLIMIQYTGLLNIINMDGTNKVGIGLNGGNVILDSATVTSGTVHVSGTGKLTDENGNYIPTGTWNGGVTIINDLMSRDTISDAVWDEDISNHTNTGTTGKTLKQTNTLTKTLI